MSPDFEEGDRVIVDAHMVTGGQRGRVCTYRGSIYDLHGDTAPGHIFVRLDGAKPYDVDSFFHHRLRKLDPVEALAELDG